jgi:hypothetical protein
MMALLRTVTIDVELAKASITENVSKGLQALGQDLSAVRDVEEPRILHLPPESLEIERSHESLAGASRSDKEIPVAVVELPFDLELLEDFDLMGERLEIKRKEWNFL